jgi:hypothetical protein
MKRLATAILAGVVALSGVSIASAGSTTGTTTLLGAAHAGSSLDVGVSVVSETPVVAYEYSIQNECNFAGKTNGQPNSIQTDPIVNWLYSDPTNTIPHAIMPLYFKTIPAGSFCKVFVLKGNQVVKGSTTSYTVQP